MVLQQRLAEAIKATRGLLSGACLVSAFWLKSSVVSVRVSEISNVGDLWANDLEKLNGEFRASVLGFEELATRIQASSLGVLVRAG